MVMASGQSKGVSWEMLGGDGAKKGLEEEEEEGESSTPRYKGGGRRYGESPEFLTKGQFQRGAEGVTIYALAKGGSRDWGKGDGLEGRASFKT